MGLLKRKKKSGMPLLLSDASEAQASNEVSLDASPTETPRRSSTPEPSLQSQERQESSHRPVQDLFDQPLFGPTIRLVRAENWDQDSIPTAAKETYILYENQRGMFFLGKPYFSGKSLIHSFKFDPPPYQNTNTFLVSHPGTVDLSDPNDKTWPPDPEKLYYSPYSPHDGLLSLDSVKGYTCRWIQDRWYIDMRGDVDEEGWEYAAYWNGRWKWFGGNWHGKHVLVHGWVRRRRWVRELERIPGQEHTPVKGQIGNCGENGFEALMSHLRELQSPNLKRKALKQFFDACLLNTMKQLPDYIHHIYMLLDALSSMTLIHLVEQRLKIVQEDAYTDVHNALSTSLSYLTSKRGSLALQPGNLARLLELPGTEWASLPKDSKPKELQDQPSRRLRLRALRNEWRSSHQAPAKLLRKVHFPPHVENEPEEFFTAPETVSTIESLERASSSESREEWFTAPEAPDEAMEPSKSVAGLLKDGTISEQAVG